MYYDGDVQMSISEIVSRVYEPKDGQPKQPSEEPT